MALDPRRDVNAEHAIFAEANTADRTALVRRDVSWKAAAKKRLDLQMKGIVRGFEARLRSLHVLLARRCKFFMTRLT